MPGSPKTEIRLRFIVENPVPGVAYSLQDRKSSPVDAAVSKDGGPLTFEFPIASPQGRSCPASSCEGKAPSAASSTSPSAGRPASIRRGAGA